MQIFKAGFFITLLLLLLSVSALNAQQYPLTTTDNFTLRNGSPSSHEVNITWFDTSPFEEWVKWTRTGPNNFDVTKKMNFRLLKPANYDPNGAQYPLIVFTHGAGQTGRGWDRPPNYTLLGPNDDDYDNNEKQLYAIGDNQLSVRNSGEFDGFAFFPQTDYPGWDNGVTTLGDLHPEAEKMLDILEDLIVTYNIDPNRVYIHGLSNGGKGTWYAAHNRPDLFAAALPMSAVGGTSMFPRLGHMPIWNFQGENDTNPIAPAAQSLSQYFQDNGGNYRYTEYANTGHNTWDPAYLESDFWSWMLSKSLKDIHVFGNDTDLSTAGGDIILGIAPEFQQYRWFKNGNQLGGETSNQLAVNSAGDYRVEFMNFIGDWVIGNTVTITGAPNQAPVVNAGIDALYTLPLSSFTLTGSASDNDGSVSSSNWTQMNGPSTASLSGGSTLTPIITNFEEGTYVFRLTSIDDDGASSFDDVSIVINPDPNSASILYRVNVGGSEVAGTPMNWETDNAGQASQYYTGNSGIKGFNNSGLFQTNNTAAPNLIFGGYRYEPTWGDVSYDFPVANGSYIVRLYFGEQLSNTDVELGDRVFDVEVEGSVFLNDFDILSEVEKDVPLQKNVTVNVSDGSLTLDFQRVVGDPIVNGIEILSNTNAGPNNNPVANAGTDEVIFLPIDQTIIYGSGSDDDGSIVAYAWSKISGPSVTIGDISIDQLFIGDLVEGVYVFELKVTDNDGAEDTNQVTITVNPEPGGNTPPTVTAGPNQIITLPTNSATLSGNATDADGTVVGFLWAQTSGPNAATFSNQATANLSVSGVIQGTYVFQLTATDDDGDSSSDQVELTVNPDPDTGGEGTVLFRINAGGDQISDNPLNWDTDKKSAPSPYFDPNSANHNTGWNYSFNSNSTDAPSNLFGTYRYGPSWGNDLTYHFPVPAGNYIVKLYFAEKAGNSVNVGDRLFDVNIEGQTVLDDYDISAEVGDGTAQKEFTVSISDGMIDIDFLRSLSDPIINGIEILLTEGEAPNSAPVANAGSDQSITLPTNSITLNGSATDSDGSITSYSWTKVSGPAATLSNETTASLDLANLVEGTYVFELEATDDDGDSSQDQVTVVVNAAPVGNQAPVVNAGSDQSITLPTDAITLNGSATDSDGTVASYAWTKVSGPAATLSNQTTASLDLANLVEGTYVFELEATDDDGDSSQDQVTVVVNAAPVGNQAPVVNAGPDQSITLPTDAITLNGSATDSDGTVASYAWTKVSGPAATLSNQTTASLDLANLVEGTYVFELEATDDDGDSSQDQVTVIVNPETTGGIVLYRINAGGDLIADSPIDWIQDKRSNPSSYLDGSSANYSTGWNYSFNSNNTDGPSNLFGTHRYGAPWGGDILYHLPVTNGNYEVKLYFAEKAGNSVDAGDRAFDVEIEGQVALANYDITAEVGDGTAQKNFSVSVTDGVLDIEFLRKISDPIINGIEVISSGGTPANQAPVVNAGSDQSITLPTNAITLNGSATDSDGTVASYAWTKVSGPAATLSNQTTASLDLANLVEGTYVFELEATDDDGDSSQDQVTVVVNAAPVGNQAPVVNAGSDQSITLPTDAITLNGSATDSDGTVASYAWTKVSGPAATLSNQTTASLDLANLVEGTYVFELEATDDDGDSSQDQVTVMVNPETTGGIVLYRINAGGDLIADSPIDWIQDKRSNPSSYLDGSSANYSTGWNYSFNSNNTDAPSNLFGTHRYGAPWGGDILYHLPVTNGNYEVKLYFAEKAGNSVDAGDRVFDVEIEGQVALANYDITAEVGDGTAQKNFSVSVTDGVLDIEFLREISDPIINGIEVISSGGTPANQAPVVNAGSDQSITLPTNAITLNGSATDSDGTVASYAWTKVSGPAATLSNQTTASLDLANLVEGTYVFELEATDDDGASDQDQVTVVVNAAPVGNQAPVVNAGSDQSITLPTNSITLNGSATDSDGNITSYSWTKISGGAATLSNQNTQNLTLTGLAVGTYVFELNATDNEGASDSDQVTVIVNSQPPVGNGTPIYRINAGGNLLSDSPIDWERDTQGSSSPYFTAGNNNTQGWNRNYTSNTTDAPNVLFGTCRRNETWGTDVKYSFPVSEGTYDVKLYFSEPPNANTQVGARVFSVELEGMEVITDYDIVASVGLDGTQQFSFQVIVTDGAIDLELLRNIGPAIISGIEILDMSAPPPPANLEPQVAERLLIYPNPASTFVEVEFASNEDDSELQILIYDQNMRVVHKIEEGLLPGQYRKTVELPAGIAKGMYLMRLSTSNLQGQIARFIIE